MFLVPSADLDRILGTMQWLKWKKKCGCNDPCDTGHDNIPDLKFILMEEFICRYSDYKQTVSQISKYLDGPKFNLEEAIRCDYHVKTAPDKESCAMKNTFKYFYMMIELTDRKLVMDPIPGRHLLETRSSTQSSKQRRKFRPRATIAGSSNDGNKAVVSPSTVADNNQRYVSRGRGRRGQELSLSPGIGGESSTQSPRKPNPNVKKKCEPSVSAGATFEDAYTNSLRQLKKVQKKNEPLDYTYENNPGPAVPLKLPIKDDGENSNNMQQTTPVIPPGFELNSPMNG